MKLQRAFREFREKEYRDDGCVPISDDPWLTHSCRRRLILVRFRQREPRRDVQRYR